MRIVRILAQKSIEENIIQKEEEEIYCFLFEYMLDTFCYGISIVLIGILIQQIIPSIVFLLSSILPRKYSGGYHASNKRRCQFLSYSVYGGAMLLYYLNRYSTSVIWLLFYIISSIGVLCFSRIDTSNKKFSMERKKQLKRKACRYYSILFLIEMVSYFLRCNILYINISICAIISLFGALIGMVKKERTNES